MKAKTVMTTKVISIEPNATVMKAARLMLQHHISGLPVVTAVGALVGIVTEGDFLRRTEIGTRRRHSLWHDILVGSGKVADEYTHAHAKLVHQVMTLEPYTITEETELADVVDLMEKRGIKRLPVMRDGKLVGIVSRANLMRAFATMGSLAPTLASDEEIREWLTAQLDNERWAPVGTIDVSVRDGMVHYWGAITDDRVREALITAAKNTPGVKEVRDHLCWIEPFSGVVISPDDEAAGVQSTAQ